MEERKRFYSNPGDPIKVVYGSRIDKHGNVIVEPKEKQNLYELIQSYAESTDINLLVKKFEAGDVMALNKRDPKDVVYGDFTNMPESYFEMVNTINDAKQEFYRLPVEIKEKFDNDENKFIATIGSTDWYSKLTGNVPKTLQQADKKVDDVKKVEEEHE